MLQIFWILLTEKGERKKILDFLKGQEKNSLDAL